jgi:hypothetical protein
LQTYYLTVELSYPEFKGSANKAAHHSRGGYYRNWHEPSNETHPAARAEAALKLREQEKQQRQRHSSTQAGNTGSNDDEPSPAPAPEDKFEEDDMPMIDPALRTKGKGIATSPAQPQSAPSNAGNGNNEPAAEGGGNVGGHETSPLEPLEDIQILDLHSDKPYISYKGRMFEGTWAEVIGTEAILTTRDDTRPLPALRHLAENVDLLGASSARLITKEKTAKAKVPEVDPLEATREEWNIRIPTAKDRTGERRQQARFLENLIALKKIRGQDDSVTVYALDGHGKHFDDDRDPDYRPRRKKTAGSELPRKSTAAKQRRMRATARTRAGRRASERGGRTRAGASSGLSTPTPSHWDEIQGRDETGDVEDEEDDEEDDDVSMGE